MIMGPRDETRLLRCTSELIWVASRRCLRAQQSPCDLTRISWIVVMRRRYSESKFRPTSSIDSSGGEASSTRCCYTHDFQGYPRQTLKKGVAVDKWGFKLPSKRLCCISCGKTKLSDTWCKEDNGGRGVMCVLWFKGLRLARGYCLLKKINSMWELSIWSMDGRYRKWMIRLVRAFRKERVIMHTCPGSIPAPVSL